MIDLINCKNYFDITCFSDIPCVTQIFSNNTTLNQIEAGIQCFKEIKLKQRNDFVKEIKKYFENIALSRFQKVQFVKQIEEEQMAENLLNV